MLVAMFGEPSHRYVSFEDAQAVGEVLGSLADKLLPSATSLEDATSLIAELRNITERSLCNSSKIWNTTHDLMRILPVELQRLCLGSLPMVDKCKLFRVCSFWHDTIAQDPTIWQNIDMVDCPLDLAGMLGRSDQLPVEVAVSVRTKAELLRANRVLGLHAYRLRSLHMTFQVEDGAVVSPSEILAFAVPQLRELELHYISPVGSQELILPSELFDCNACHLRSVVLHGIGLPSPCDALANVSSASIQGACPGMQDILFIMPSLERLELLNVLGHPGQSLPELRRSNKVTNMRIRDSRLVFFDLEQLGYLRIAQLHVVSEDGMALVTAAAAHFVASSESTLVIGNTGPIELLIQRSQGSTASFAAEKLSFRELRSSFSSFRDITRLVLPLHFSTTMHNWAGKRACPLLQGELELPRLRSLAIRGAPRSPMGCGLLDPAIARGVIVAPLLVRLELTAGPMRHGKPFCVRPGDLATFVEKHLRLAKFSPLEVFIDTANGVRLKSINNDKDVYRLYRCIGTLIE